MLRVRAAGMNDRMTPCRSDPEMLSAEKSSAKSVCSESIIRVKFPNSKIELDLLAVTMWLPERMVSPDSAATSLSMTTPLTLSIPSGTAETGGDANATVADKLRTAIASGSAMRLRTLSIKVVGEIFMLLWRCTRSASSSEPGADRGSRAGSPRGVVDATGFVSELRVTSSILGDAVETRSLPLPVLIKLSRKARPVFTGNDKRLNHFSAFKVSIELA